jgi:hypothetical protein
MTDPNHSGANGRIDDLAHENPELEKFAEETRNDDIVAKAATIVVVGAGVALISAELLPGMLIGVAAAFLPSFGKKLRPLFKSTVRASYSAIQKTREMVAEAKEQVEDVVAEARADHESKSESSAKPARPSAG